MRASGRYVRLGYDDRDLTTVNVTDGADPPRQSKRRPYAEPLSAVPLLRRLCAPRNDRLFVTLPQCEPSYHGLPRRAVGATLCQKNTAGRTTLYSLRLHTTKYLINRSGERSKRSYESRRIFENIRSPRYTAGIARYQSRHGVAPAVGGGRVYKYTWR